MEKPARSGPTTVVQVRVSHAAAEVLDGWAEEAGVSRSEFVRGLLRTEQVRRQKREGSLYRPRPTNP